jgi:hypothetical protein
MTFSIYIMALAAPRGAADLGRGRIATTLRNRMERRSAPLTGGRRRGTVAQVCGRGAMRRAVSGRIACAALVGALSLGALSQSRAADWWELNFGLSGPRYDRVVPACNYQYALDRIIDNFRTKEFRFWKTELRIVGFENIHETAMMPWAAQSVPRRYCSGTAVINDGVRHPIYYSIAESMGMIGANWGVNFCVDGLDRDMSYGPDCRAAQP